MSRAAVDAWDALDAAKQAAWNTRADKAFDKIVAEAKKLAPELKIEKKHMSWQPKLMAKDNAFARSATRSSSGWGSWRRPR